MRRIAVGVAVVEFCNVDRPGDTTYVLGRGPIGYFIYGEAGDVSVQMMRAVPAAAFTKDSVPLVVHHVRGGTIPSYIGSEQRRNFRFRGDTLSISEHETWGCRKLVRER